jgi:hypothetical protein
MHQHYGIRHVDGHWWAGDNKWSKSAAPARWFDSSTAAELAALRDLHESRECWTVKLIDEKDY